MICRPWQQPNHGKFTKSEFEFDMRARTITCPNGQTQPFRLGASAKFDARTCDRCPLRSRCTSAAKGQGREVFIHPNEPLQHRLRKLTDTSSGRAQLRERVPVEHRLAHLSQRQGDRARYLGIRKNTFDTRRASALQNLETTHRRHREEAQRAAA